MNVFTVLWEDRHCEADVTVFAKKKDAIKWANEQIDDLYAHRKDEIDYELYGDGVFCADLEDSFSMFISKAEVR